MTTWVKWLVLGLVTAAFGLFALGNAVAASIAVTLVTGMLFIIAGAGEIVVSFGEAGAGHKILGLLLGVIMVLLGISFISNPLEGTVSLALVVTILIAAGGAIRLFLAFAMRQTPFFWTMLLSGALRPAGGIHPGEFRRGVGRPAGDPAGNRAAVQRRRPDRLRVLPAQPSGLTPRAAAVGRSALHAFRPAIAARGWGVPTSG